MKPCPMNMYVILLDEQNTGGNPNVTAKSLTAHTLTCRIIVQVRVCRIISSIPLTYLLTRAPGFEFGKSDSDY
jgi:hypothetical protein